MAKVTALALLATGLTLAGGVCLAAPAAVVNVSLSGETLDKMEMKVDRTEVPAGEVTFHVVNDSKDLIHEMLVLKPVAGQALAYDEKEMKIDEEAAGDLGEVGDLDPGNSGDLTLKLEPGTYLLVCNEAGHYKAGMTAPFLVTR